MRLKTILRTSACALAVAGLLGTTTVAGDEVAWCDKDDSDCRTVAVDVDGNPNVFFVGDSAVRVPRLSYAFNFGGGGYMGVNLVNLTPELRDYFGVPDDTGVMISRVDEDTPAFTAGIEVGDVITAVDGEEIESAADLSRLIRRRDDGDEVEVELYRDGRPLTVDITLAERERPQFNVGNWIFSKDGNEDTDATRRMILDIDPDSLKESMEQFRKFQTYWNVDSDGKQVFRIRNIERDLESKIEALEDRIRDLEKQINRSR